MSRQLHIAMFGSACFVPPPHLHANAACCRAILRYFTSLGHRLTIFLPDSSFRPSVARSAKIARADAIFYPDTPPGRAAAIASADSVDFLIHAASLDTDDPRLHLALLDAKSTRAPTVLWDLDPQTTIRRAASPDHWFRPLLARYDLVLAHGAARPLADAFRALGAPRCMPLAHAVNPRANHPVSHVSRFRADLACLADRRPHRSPAMDQFFLDPAADCPQRSFLLAGLGWSNQPLARNVRYLGRLRTRERNAFHCSPRAVLNVTPANHAAELSPQPSLFQAAAAGACIITNHLPGIDQYLEPGREILLAGDGQEVLEHLEALSAEQAQAVGRHARLRILAHHTSLRRANQILNFITSG